ncbi:hypothetical protein ES703_57749 [subsurface metagenome]
MNQPCTKVWYPKDRNSFSQTNPIRVHLNEGRQVAVGSNGWFIESWSPFTKKLFSLGGDEIGTREEPPKVPSTTEFRKTGYITIDKDNKNLVPDGWWKSNGAAVDWLDKVFESNPDAQITFDSDWKWIETWSASAGEVYDIDGEVLLLRSTAFGEHTVLSEVKNPLRATYRPADKDKFHVDSDAWLALNAGRDVTVDDRGVIIDIWDPATGKQYDILGNEIGTRTDPYPSDNNLGDIKAEARALEARINALRRQMRDEKGAAKAATNAKIMALLRERGRALWLYGRLLGRKRRMDEAYNKRKTQGK